jgi:diguanylate cyclase (GGDEF)-like protein
MQKILVDWGMWDDTYKFINNQNQEYIDSNLQEATLKNLNLEDIIYLDKDRKIIFSKENKMEKNNSRDFVDKLSINNINFNKANNGCMGLLLLRGKVYITGVLPVTTSDEQSKSNGFLIMVREIDAKLLDYIEKITPIKLMFKQSEQEKFKQGDYISYIDLGDTVITYNKNNSEANKTIKDINGKDSIVVTIIDNVYNTEEKEYFLKSFISKFLCLIAIIMLFNIIVINKYILIRLFKLTKFIEKVNLTKDTTLVIDMSGKDEIYRLANETNRMLSTLDSAYREILFLSYSDKITSLKNRAYMEKMFDELDTNKKDNYYIIMGDINGLKLTNDALGHSEGDKLLCFVGRILTESCSADDIISRWGGDEFIILVKNKQEIYVANLIDKIKDYCENELEFDFKISIALGYAGNGEENQNTDAVMSLAEKRMYRNKLMDNKSARSAAINSLLRTLHEKHSETEAHTMRIKKLSIKLGKRIGLTKEKLDELELLSLLHDMGKIGIPEHILMKPSKLTDEEWTIMKTHSDIGYRIASSTPELAHIANEILAHHERYDGTGYPNKLKEEEIPLLSRIISIVDSFDVMTHKRIYKEAFDREYVIEELKRCAGTQFDPELIKEFIILLEDENVY